MARKDKKKKGKKEKDSESSTPSSTPSVEDERLPLLRSGACASKSSKKTKSGRKISEGKQASYQSLGATSSGNATHSDNLSKTSLSSGPESHASPSKMDSLRHNILNTEQKSHTPSSNTECHCDDKQNHRPECLERKGKISGAIPKKKSSKQPASSSKTISKKNKNGTESYSSSDPSLLVVPDQGEEAHTMSPSKNRSPCAVKPGWSSSPNRSSNAECSCEDTENHQPECSEGEGKFTGAIPKKKSQKQPASSSKTTSKKSKDGTESSSSSNPNHLVVPDQSAESHTTSPLKKSSLPWVSIPSWRRSRNRSSKKNGRVEHNIQLPSGDNYPEIQEDLIPLIQHMDVIGEEERALIGRLDTERQGLIPRSRSRLYIPEEPEPQFSRQPSPRRYDFSSVRHRIRQIRWDWLEEIRQRDRNLRRDPARDVPDEQEYGLLGQVVRHVPAVRRHQSHSPVDPRPCDCNFRRGGLGHEMTCARGRDARQNRKWRKCRQDAKPTGF